MQQGRAGGWHAAVGALGNLLASWNKVLEGHLAAWVQGTFVAICVLVRLAC